MVYIAQLVRVPDCDSGGREFNSHYTPKWEVQPVKFVTIMTWGSGVALREFESHHFPKLYLRVAKVVDAPSSNQKNRKNGEAWWM